MDLTQPGSNFWSRRRAAVEAEAAAESVARDAAIAAEAQAALEAEQADKTEAEILEELGLKNPEEMAAGDDFAAFMKSAVPEHLRRRALRVLWRSNPVLANLDGLLDHDDDFSDSATVMPNMKTAYQVGKGMLHHVKILAEQAERLAFDDPEESPASVAIADPTPDGEAAQLVDDTDENVVDTDETDEVSVLGGSEGIDVVPCALQRRHMRFEFADQPGGDT